MKNNTKERDDTDCARSNDRGKSKRSRNRLVVHGRNATESYDSLLLCNDLWAEYINNIHIYGRG